MTNLLPIQSLFINDGMPNESFRYHKKAVISNKLPTKQMKKKHFYMS